MAILKGDIKFTGKIGGLVSRKVKDKYVLSKPGGFTKERLEKGRDTNYKPIFQQNAEFKMSSNLCKRIYNSLKSILDRTYFESETFNALMSKIHRNRIHDSNAEIGKRRPTVHTLNLLRNFHFNERAMAAWRNEPKLIQNPMEGPTIKLKNVRKDIKWPRIGDKIRLIAIHLQVDLNEINVTPINAEYLEIDRADAKQPIEWKLNPIPSNTLTALAVEFYEEVNNHYYQLFNRNYTPLHIMNFKE